MNIHFRVTNYCNLQCKECWGIRERNITHMHPDTFVKALECIAPFNMEDKINITGGEPTVSPYFKDIIRIAQQLDVFKTVSTNAYKISSDLVDELLKFERLQLPLDGSTSLKFNGFRRDATDYLSKITYTVNALKQKKYDGIIKFGTVIVENNLMDIENIYDKIKSYNLKKVEWRLYPLLKKGEKYRCIVPNDKLLQVKRKCEESKIRFSAFTPENRNEKYLFINPSGSISTVVNNEEIILGHIKGK